MVKRYVFIRGLCCVVLISLLLSFWALYAQWFVVAILLELLCVLSIILMEYVDKVFDKITEDLKKGKKVNYQGFKKTLFTVFFT